MRQRSITEEIMYESMKKRHFERIHINSRTVKDIELEKSLFLEANNLGYYIQMSYDFMYMEYSDKALLPILLKYIGRFDDDGISSNLVRSIAIRGFYDATEFLLSQFKRIKTKDHNLYRESVAVALNKIRDARYVGEYIELIKNPQTHNDTFFIIDLLGTLKVEKAIPLLLELLHDPDISLQSASLLALAHFKRCSDLIPYIEPFLESKNKVLKQHAIKAIKKLRPQSDS